MKPTKVKNPISTKAMPSTPDPPKPISTRSSFAGPGVSIVKSTKSYKKGKG